MRRFFQRSFAQIVAQRARRNASNGERAGALHESLERRALLSAMPQGPEFRVNTHTTGAQINSSAAMDNAGNFVVVWQSAAQEGVGSGDGVYAQRYSASGVAQGAEFPVNQFTIGNQQAPAVAMDADGDFVVVWSSAGQMGALGEIWARRFNAAGVPQGDEFHVNETTTNQQLTPAVAMDNAGNFAVTWVSRVGTGAEQNYDVYARRYNAAGVPAGGEFQVNTYTTSSQVSPVIAMDADGDTVVVWQSYFQEATGASNGIYAQRYDATGAAAGTEFIVNQFTTNAQQAPAVSMDNAGNFVVAWESNLQEGVGSAFGIYARRFNAAGAPIADEFRVNTTTIDQQRIPAVAVDDDGDFVVTWAGRPDGSLYGIYGQCFNAAGATVGNEFRVNTTTTNSQFNPAVATDSDGDFIVTWQSDLQDGSGFGIYGQRYGATQGTGPVVVNSGFFFETPPQHIGVGFSANVSASFDAADVEIMNVDTMAVIPTANILVTHQPGNEAIITFPGYAPTNALPDGNYRARLIAAGITDPGGTPMAADHTVEFFFLQGDITRDRRVNLADFNVLAINFGQTGRMFSQGNLNYDAAGTVNLQDFNLLAIQFGKSLPGAMRPGIAPSGAAPLAGSGKRDNSDRMIGVVG